MTAVLSVDAVQVTVALLGAVEVAATLVGTVGALVSGGTTLSVVLEIEADLADSLPEPSRALI